MTDQYLYQWALWLETIGFGLSAAIVLLIKWKLLKNVNDAIKSFVRIIPYKLFRMAKPLLWLISTFKIELHAEIPKGLDLWERDFWVRAHGVGLAIISMLIIVISLLLTPVFIIALAAKLLSGHNAITNTLIVIGTIMILAGLIIELRIVN